MKKEVDENGDEIEPAEEEPAPVGFVQDLLADMRLFQYAGIGFGE